MVFKAPERGPCFYLSSLRMLRNLRNYLDWASHALVIYPIILFTFLRCDIRTHKCSIYNKITPKGVAHAGPCDSSRTYI